MKGLMEQKTKYLYLVIFFFLLYLSFLLVKPFILAILVSFVVAYLIYPVYKKINIVIKNKGVCAFFLIILLFLVIILPLFLVAEMLIPQSVALYHNIANIDLKGIDAMLNDYFNIEMDTGYYVKSAFSKLIAAISKDVSEFALSVPKKLIVVFVSIFFMYYLLKEGDDINKDLKRYLPLKEEYKNELIEKLKNVTYATVYGVIATALVQGIAATIGFYIFDVDSPMLFGLITVICAMLPFGAAIVWLPIAFAKIISGNLFSGIGLLLYGLLVVSLIDNFVRPMIISKKLRIHPLIVILGVFGGLSFFGFIGILVGPLILAVLIAFLDFYLREYEA